MNLRSRDGTTFTLAIRSRQFPSATPADEWDANWLIISGETTLASGRSHSFTDPRMTTWEARDLGHWLQAIAGRTAVEPAIAFTEPCLAFDATHLADAVELRVHLRYEAAALSAEERDCLHLHLGIDQLRHAAKEWTAALRPYFTN